MYTHIYLQHDINVNRYYGFYSNTIISIKCKTFFIHVTLNKKLKKIWSTWLKRLLTSKIFYYY